MSGRALVTNFAYGTGPYLRTTELALAFNDELEARGLSRLAIVVPWVYGEKQRRIMLEEFGEHALEHPDEILLDPALGQILKGVFYSGTQPYREALRRWIETSENASRAAHAHLSGVLDVETLGGAKSTIDGRGILLELNRSPRIRYDVGPSFSTTFGYVADILEKAASLPPGTIDVDSTLLSKGALLADTIEGKQAMHCMAYPATFSHDSSYADRYGGTLVPPIMDLPKSRSDSLVDDGIFVTVTGIEGLERLYAEARDFGLTLYSNDTEAISGSVKALPSAIANDKVRLHFARAGWGSLWLSMFLGAPVVVPRYEPSDDPEIYFNNLALARLGFGVVYEGQPLAELLARADACRQRAEALRREIGERWQTLNGNVVCAKVFAARYVSGSD